MRLRTEAALAGEGGPKGAVWVQGRRRRERRGLAGFAGVQRPAPRLTACTCENVTSEGG